MSLAAVLRKSPEMVSRWVGEGVRRRLADRDYALQMDELDQRLGEAAGEGLQRGFVELSDKP